jgi:glucokinase
MSTVEADTGENVVLGLDVGGTFLKAIAVSGLELAPPRAAAPTVLRRVRRPTAADDGPDAVVARVLELLAELRDELAREGTPPHAVGVAVPGVVDEEAGVVRFSANIGWRELPIRRLLEDGLSLPVGVGHDVRLGCLAEGAIGAAKGVADYAFVAIGTGIAGALHIGGAPFPGAHGRAGELGHIIVEPRGEQCGCGERGCLETVSSAAAIVRRYRARAGVSLDAARIWALSVAGDPVAAAVCGEAVEALANVLAALQSTLDIALIVIGGGLAGAGKALLEPLEAALAGRLPVQVTPRLTTAELGAEAACVGASMLACSLLPAAVVR